MGKIYIQRIPIQNEHEFSSQTYLYEEDVGFLLDQHDVDILILACIPVNIYKNILCMHGQLFESLAYFRVYYLKKTKSNITQPLISIKNFKYMYNLVTILY